MIFTVWISEVNNFDGNKPCINTPDNQPPDTSVRVFLLQRRRKLINRISDISPPFEVSCPKWHDRVVDWFVRNEYQTFTVPHWLNYLYSVTL